jgi:hypothetical protein
MIMTEKNNMTYNLRIKQHELNSIASIQGFNIKGIMFPQFENNETRRFSGTDFSLFGDIFHAGLFNEQIGRKLMVVRYRFSNELKEWFSDTGITEPTIKMKKLYPTEETVLELAFQKLDDLMLFKLSWSDHYYEAPHSYIWYNDDGTTTDINLKGY